jgi:hypothetical protein
MDNPPERLYHYTTPEGLIGIVKNNCLWATSVFYLNDAQELIGGVQIARKHLEAIRDNSTGKDEKARVEWLLNDVRNVGTAQSMDAFVCSLTSAPDLLSQWRAYCRGGGFSIGFPADQLRDAVAQHKFSLNECVYSVTEQTQLMKDTVDRVAIPWIRNATLPVSEDGDRFKIGNKLTWELVRTASRLKNSSFSEESESRIVSLPERGYDANNLFFRARGGLVVPYTELTLPDSADFWGRVRIVIGPTPHPNESKRSVYDLVRRYRGHAVGISITQTPYREW